MPRFFFDTYDGEVYAKDEEGTDLADVEIARLRAQDTLADLARQSVLRGPAQRHMFVRVHDEAGEVVLTGMLAIAYDVAP